MKRLSTRACGFLISSGIKIRKKGVLSKTEEEVTKIATFVVLLLFQSMSDILGGPQEENEIYTI